MTNEHLVSGVSLSVANQMVVITLKSTNLLKKISTIREFSVATLTDLFVNVLKEVSTSVRIIFI